MAFTPLSENQIKEQGLLPNNSVMDFEILESVTLGTTVIDLEARESKNGNPMIVAPVAIYNDEGNKIQTIIDYIVITDRMMFKVKNLCEVCGLMEEYNAGDEHAIVAKLAGKTGKVKIGVQKATDDYPAKNNIRDYVSGGGALSEQLDDTVPF